MKKLLAIILSGTLLVSSVPALCYAADVDTAAAVKAEEAIVSSTEPTDQGLKDAITQMKKKITVPKEYSEFEYYYNDSGSYTGPIWTMYWENPADNSRIMVSCDTKFHITYYNKYNFNNKDSGVAKYLKTELKEKADAFIKNIAPETAGNLKFIDAEYEGIYSGNYVYNYQRIANGIDFPDNTVTIWVNSVTGEVIGTSINWIYGITIPDSSVKLSKDEASALIKKNTELKLVYKSDYYRYYDISGSTTRKAFLVYEPVDSYISVDAKTGEVYKTRSEWIDTGRDENGKGATAAEDSSSANVSSGLTEEEITKVEELKNLISKSKAIETVKNNSYLYLDKNLKSYSATLNKQSDGSGDTSYVWYINLSDPREVNYESESDYYRAYAYATVDAQTGKILSFYASLNDNYDQIKEQWKTVKIAYNKAEAQKILEKFLKSQITDRFNHSVLSSQTDGYIAYYNEKEPVYGGYTYQYNRVNEEVEYPNNYINGSVDGVTGKIYSYSSYWDKNITFESTKGAMTADQAMDYYLGYDGYGLKYEINTVNKYDSKYGSDKELYDYTQAYSAEYQVRLVYRPDVTPSYISPFTGERLNYNGEVYKETPPYSYKDVTNNAENRNILLLSDMNIGFEGEYFMCDNNITKGEISDLLTKVGYVSSSETIENADKAITREELAQLFIIRMGLEKISKIKGIYKTGFADENSIGYDYFGAVALAQGLGLMSGDSSNYFHPMNKVTRLEAVNLLMNFITVVQSSSYN
jgi:hypothetical protein